MDQRLDEHPLAPSKPTMIVIQDDISRPEVTSLFDAHINALRAINTGADAIGHVLDLSSLRHQSITIFTVRTTDSNEVIGCAALKHLSPDHGELKSMRTAAGHERKGVAGALIRHILDEAMARGYRRVSLETGIWEDFAAARALYAKHGFVPCDAYGGYEEPTSAFMTYHIEQLNPSAV